MIIIIITILNDDNDNDFCRWLMKSAARTGKIVLSIVTCDGRYLPYHIRKKDFKSSQSIQQHLQSISSHPVRIDSRIRKIVDHEIHRRPSYTPSIGSRHSDHESLINTVEMAAKIAGRNSFRYSNKKLEGKVQYYLYTSQHSTINNNNYCV